MKRLTPELMGFWGLMLAVFGFRNAPAQTPHALLPMPAEMHWGKGRLSLKTPLKLQLDNTTDPAVGAAATRLLARLQGAAKPAANGPVLQIRYGRPGRPEKFDEERYSLRVTPVGVSIDAGTSLGVLRALATLEQLPVGDKRLRYLPEVDIQDQPRFAWRGLLMDAARHFLPVAVIKRNLDGMAAVKLNVLHWHLADDQGFRVESKLLPRFQQVAGANGFYTQDEVRDVVAYAAARGIRVVPEFDVPGHATSWIAAYPRLASNDSAYAVATKWGVLNVAMDPTRETTYSLLDSLFTEMTGLFPDPYFHIGGDENDGRQWRRNPRIAAYMRGKGMVKADGKTVDNHQLQTYFNRRVLAMVQKHGKTIVGWDEILGPDLPKEAVIQSWRGKKGLNEAAKLGHPVLLSNGYYLDLYYSAASHYAADPLPADTPLSAAEQKLVLGGEAAMWSEFADSAIVDSRIWPRAAAVAERLWSPQAATQDVADMYRRLAAVSTELETLGLRHRRAPEQLLAQLAGAGNVVPLRTLAEAVEPVKEYKRHSQGFKYTTLTPLNRLVDAAPAESEVARRFGALVDSVVASSATPAGRPAGSLRQLAALRAQLMLWQANDSRLQLLLVLNPALREYGPLSTQLAAVSKVLLERVTQLQSGQAASPAWLAGARATLDAAQAPAGQVELAIVRAGRKLVGA